LTNKLIIEFNKYNHNELNKVYTQENDLND